MLNGAAIMESRKLRSGVEIIRDEHASLGAVLHGLTQMLRRGPGHEPEQFFSVVRAMLFYIDEFPEKRHHPKESDVLFPKLARCAPETMPVIQRLEQEHIGGHERVRELQHLLLAWELLGDSRRQEFVEETAKYVEFYFKHMKVEETELLPVATRCLTQADVAELDAAFQGNSDPLGPEGPRSIYQTLFTRIVLQAPAPVGVGPA
jgi:hemerythrin-like domain-containing protein